MTRPPMVVLEGNPTAAYEDTSPGSWNEGIASIEVVFHGLVDWTETVPRYEPGPSPNAESPAVVVLLSEVTGALLSALEGCAPDELIGRWLPQPIDVRNMDFKVGTEGEPTLYHRRVLFLQSGRASVLDESNVVMDLGEVAQPDPWEVARTHARGAAKTGRYFEAVVWANVALEAFVDQAIRDFISEGRLDEAIVNSKMNIYSDAELILAQQFPEMAGKVAWPGVERSPSRPRQIKAVAQSIPLKANHRELNKIAARVSNVRNDAVHGRSVTAVSLIDAELAISGLDEFVEKFRS